MVLISTGLVIREKLAVVAPLRTVTEAGMDPTAEFPLVTVNVTVVSPLDGTPMVTVPVLAAPPMTDVGENFKELGTLGVTVKVPVTVVPFAPAEIFTVVDDTTALVEMTKLAVELPANTVTVPGMEATAEPPLTIVKVTGMSTGAVPAMVTVPVVLVPPIIDVGLNFNVLG